MPQYRFGCDSCGSDVLVWCMREERTLPRDCGTCGKPMRQLAPSRIHLNCDRLDFVTADITGVPVRIQTKAQLNKLCEANGVRRVSSDEVGQNKRKSIEDIARASGVGDLKSDCERTAQALGVPLTLPTDPAEWKKVVKRTIELLTAGA
ncbi:MAG: hypothetical protein IT366_24535 [Candidatus Hydrogenedentes bacterium]|nr:hypothetical protein [Candidatus Hydrogenedentota bacterium]